MRESTYAKQKQISLCFGDRDGVRGGEGYAGGMAHVRYTRPFYRNWRDHGASSRWHSVLFLQKSMPHIILLWNNLQIRKANYIPLLQFTFLQRIKLLSQSFWSTVCALFPCHFGIAYSRTIWGWSHWKRKLYCCKHGKNQGVLLVAPTLQDTPWG